nr:mannose-1-phosphate guanylyltransferase [Clostridium chrysemydis]
MELKKYVIYGLILAGGKGSRLYPLSRVEKPKQFLKVINEKSFLVNTVERITPLIEKENIYVVTNKDYEDQIKEDLSDINENNIITEPMNKETATCIGLSAVRLLKEDNDAVMVVLPSDHHIENEKAYIETLSQAVDMANRRRCIVTLGIAPTRPETGYGYIEMGDRVSGIRAAYKVARFTEKPNTDVAKDFIYKGTYLWNSGMFIFRADVILREIGKYLPDMYKSLMEIYKHIGEEDQDEVIEEEYRKINGISIDFGIMQKTRKACVIQCDFDWDDIGSFSALSRFLDNKKESNNAVSNNVYLEECENCSVFGNKNLIIGLGIKDIVVVDAGDVILVMDRNKDQEIKHLLNNLEKQGKYYRFL